MGATPACDRRGRCDADAMKGLHRLRGTALAIAIVLMAPLAHAQIERARVEVVDCPPELGEAVEGALDVELSMATEEARAALASGTLRCALLCDAAGTTAVVVRGDDRVEHRIDGSGPGLPRRLAIALAELLDASAAVASDAAVAPDAAAVPAPEPPPAPVEPPSSIEPEPEREGWVTRVRASGGLWLGGDPLLALGTLDVGVELAPTTNVALVIGAAGALGAIDVDAGRLDVRLVSAHASVRLGGEWGPVWLGGGPAVRGGAVLWTGTPTDPSRAVGRDTTGGWLGVGAIAVAWVRAGDTPLRVGIEAEGGGIAVHSEALVRGVRGARIGDGWLELRLAVDVAIIE